MTTGFGFVAAELDRLCDSLVDAAEEALQGELYAIAETAKRLAPVKTGTLQRSIASGTQREGNSIAGFVKATAPYAVSVEMGGALPPRPFLYPAFKAVEKNIAKAIGEAILKGR